MPGSVTPVTLSELARACDARVSGDGEMQLRGLASLEGARADELAFARSAEMRERALGSRAGALIVPEDFGPLDRPGLVAANVDAALALIGEYLLQRACPPPGAGVHESAFLGTDVTVGDGASIGPLSVVEDGARIGPRARIGAGCFVGRGAEVGEATLVHPNATIGWGCRVGARCIVHSGAVIGADGFGYAKKADGGYRKIPQVGNVVVEDDVEIGACTCIDRATVDSTVIARGVKLDNLVHVAHNCVIGENAAMAALVGIAGSTKIGRSVELGGQSGVAGHLELGDGCRVGAGSPVIKSFGEGEELWGFPAREKSRALREMAFAARAEKVIAKLTDDIRELRAQVAEGRRDSGGSRGGPAKAAKPKRKKRTSKKPKKRKRS